MSTHTAIRVNPRDSRNLGFAPPIPGSRGNVAATIVANATVNHGHLQTVNLSGVFVAVDGPSVGRVKIMARHRV
ncbi:MAG: hypothetical protein ACREEE_17815, partial [Dongiaceae bacterium]